MGKFPATWKLMDAATLNAGGMSHENLLFEPFYLGLDAMHSALIFA